MDLISVRFHDPTQVLAPELSVVDLDLAADVPQLLGPPHWIDVSSGGPPSPERGWLFRAPCGLTINFRQWHAGAWIGANLLLVNSSAELDHARAHLPFATTVRWTNVPSLRVGFGLYRVDDHGHEFEVGVFPRVESAECVARQLSTGAHKQAYFVRTLDGPPPRTLAETGRWQVWRSDDNGFTQLVTRHCTQTDAETHVAELEEEPRHKNTYWVEASR